eukprot:scaffold18734_cov115-Skeletonema_dohrnii-CCMP3373.AAC.5
MPSRKKAKGKARRAAKEAKAKKEEDSQAVVAAANQRRQEGPLEVMMQRQEIIPFAPNKCHHGLAPSPSTEEMICQDFIHTFIEVSTSQDGVVESVTAALEATKEEYADVYSSKLETVVSILVASGTHLILDGDKYNARLYGVLAYFFEDMNQVKVQKSKAHLNCVRVFELGSADDHTLVKFFRKRISCSCLDEKYKEVKSVKKMGLCYNQNCSLPERKAERSKMFYCTRCRDANYCSVECQKDDWETHRKFCNRIAAKKAAFNNNKQS